MSKRSQQDIPISIEDEQKIDAVCDKFEQAFRRRENPRIEDFAGSSPQHLQRITLCQLIETEIELLRKDGLAVNKSDYMNRFPDAAKSITALQDVEIDASPQRQDPEGIPNRVGRYEIRRVLGKGAFGRVYLAYDPNTDRDVALKVPNQRHFDDDNSVESFLAEARSAGQLNHSGIVTIYDAQVEEEQPFIVQAYISGCDLKAWSQTNHRRHCSRHQ